MATTELKTRIILRNDTHGNWEAVKATAVLLKGEIGIEFDGSKARVKIGDGTSAWKDLPYFGEDNAQVYQVECANGADHLTAIATVCTSPIKNDIAIVKEAIDAEATKRQYTAYVYSGTAWVAMDGNYNAENVYFANDLTYTKAIGELPAVPSTGSATLSAAGKSVKEILATILAKRAQPSITNPTANFKSYSGVTSITVEPGYAASGTVSYELQLASAGSYTYGPATGVTESGTYSITYNDGTTAGQTKNTKTGSFPYSFTVGTSNVTVAVTASSVGHTQGTVAKDNLGDNSNPVKQIAAGSVSAGTQSHTFTSSRKSFWSVDGTLNTVLHPATTSDAEKAADSWLIRSLASKEFGTKTSYSLPIPQGNKRVIIAVPGSKSLKSVIDVDGMGLDIKDKFTTYTNNIYVGGCDATSSAIGSYGTTYTVFIFENAAGMAASTFNITLQ